MSNLFLTLVIAFVIIVLALACLAIGWLITGKTKLEKGACGRDPTQKKDDHCQSICHVCAAPIDSTLRQGEEAQTHEDSEIAPLHVQRHPDEQPKFPPLEDPANQ